MFGIFKSEAPRYRGTVPINGHSEGILGALARVLGRTKPEYRGAGQPTASSFGLFGWFSESPVYRTASAEEPAPEPEAEPEPTTQPEAALASGDVTSSHPEPEPELAAEDEPAGAGNGEGDQADVECGKPVFARAPVTIVIRRSQE